MSGTEFTLKYEFKDVGRLRDGQDLNSSEETHLGMEWSIGIEKSADVLRMYFRAYTGDGEMHVDFTKRIFSKNKQKVCSISGSKVFAIHAVVLCPFIDWKTMEMEYLNDGKLDVEIHLKITRMYGLPMFLMRMFEVAMERENYEHQISMLKAPMPLPRLYSQENSTPKIAFPRKELTREPLHMLPGDSDESCAK
ncbi:unnamed protein product [Caenorhabditis nigoni]